MKYFDIDQTVLLLLKGEVTIYQIKSLRNTNKKQGYTDRAEFFDEVIRRYRELRNTTTK